MLYYSDLYFSVIFLRHALHLRQSFISHTSCPPKYTSNVRVVYTEHSVSDSTFPTAARHFVGRLPVDVILRYTLHHSNTHKPTCKSVHQYCHKAVPVYL